MPAMRDHWEPCCNWKLRERTEHIHGFLSVPSALRDRQEGEADPLWNVVVGSLRND